MLNYKSKIRHGFYMYTLPARAHMQEQDLTFMCLLEQIHRLVINLWILERWGLRSISGLKALCFPHCLWNTHSLCLVACLCFCFFCFFLVRWNHASILNILGLGHVLEQTHLFPDTDAVFYLCNSRWVSNSGIFSKEISSIFNVSEM